MALEKAKFIELDQTFTKVKDGGQTVDVQFNPESLKLTYANELKQPDGGDQGGGNAGRQFVGGGTTKLALQLWFDVTAMRENPVDDVRKLTRKVVYFMNAQASTDPKDKGKKVPPGVRFSWGNFKFDGMIEGMEETVEFFSPDGKALRASITLTMSQQKILIAELPDGNGPSLPGRKPLTRSKQGDSLQGMAAKKGNADWQSLASANGIEDPLRLPAGQLIDLNAGMTEGAGGRFGLGGGLDASLDVVGSAGVSVKADINAKGLNASLRGGF
jgi:Contractile injection system tube protein/LysM domain